ncbi:hypothetical protein B0O79_3336 [Flavobacteriaceae bacterium MAR_2009_75]|nr:hypothetical protein B0O79_3336 [Flavobacteriaceae bacterium MAR_2009_75]
MKIIALKIISYIGLALTLIPSFLVFANLLELQDYKTLILVGTIIWLFTAPFWINKQNT